MNDMTNEILEYMNLKLKELLPYQYYEWSTKVVYPYWIGEYSEIPSNAKRWIWGRHNDDNGNNKRQRDRP